MLFVERFIRTFKNKLFKYMKLEILKNILIFYKLLFLVTTLLSIEL